MEKNRKMIKKQTLAMALLAALLFSVAAGNQTRAQNEQQTQTSLPFLAMPEEYLNYTISGVNGTLWAKIDGLYPMHLSPESGMDTLPMLYPIPPGTTNIHVKLGDSELSWSNYSEIDPQQGTTRTSATGK